MFAPSVNSHPVRSRSETGALLAAISIGGIMTVVAYAIVDLIFWMAIPPFEHWRQIRSEYAFQFPSHYLPSFFLCWLATSAAIQARTWVIPFGIGIILAPMLLPMVAYSGPGYLSRAVEPLVALRDYLILLTIVLAAVPVIVWIVWAKRRAR